MTSSRRLIVVLLSFALPAAACGGDDSVASTSTVPATTVTEAPTTSAAPATTTAAPTTTTTTTEPPPAGPPPGSVLITNEDGVYVGTIDGVASQVIDADPGVVGGMIGFAIDDTVGGIVFQPNHQPFLYMGDDSIVYWVPQGSGAPQELLVPAADQGLGLEDVVNNDGVQVYYTRVEGRSSPETAKQTLRRFDVAATTVTEVTTVGGWESGSSPISAGGNTIVSNGVGEGYYWMSFYDLDGVLFDSPANPIPDGEFDCAPECFYYGDVSPDGTLLAVGRLATNAGGFAIVPEIEVRNIATGAVVLSVVLPEVPAFPWIHSLDLSDTHVLINIVEEGSEYPYATIVDIASGGLVTYPAPVGGVARFLRSMPDLDGVVAWPG